MTALGVDIGGTNTRVGVVSDSGEILVHYSLPTEPERGSQFAIDQLSKLIEEAVTEAHDPPVAMGLAVTGPVDHRTGVVNNPYTLKGWGPTDLIDPFQSRFGVPVRVENDANAAALGELWCGAGRGVGRLAVVTIGTGIGVGLVVDGQIQRDPRGRHGEAGHHVLDSHGPRCYCGAFGCWEVLASGPALVRLGRQRLKTTPGVLTDGEIADAVITAALAGEQAATDIIEQIAGWVGLGLVNTTAFFMPGAIIIGGGLGDRCFPLMLRTINTVLQRHAAMIPTDGVEILPATTGDDAGLLGAAFAALQERAVT